MKTRSPASLPFMSFRCQLMAVSVLGACFFPASGQDPSPAIERGKAEAARAQLNAKWRALGKEASEPANKVLLRGAVKLRIGQPMALKDEAASESVLTAPERQSLARKSTATFIAPDVVTSRDGKLRVTLTCALAHNRIGEDPVFLRAYNGKLVGPTLRAKPGDTLHITLKNDMEPEQWQPGMMNHLNSFNSTNLHTHGLHVSPGGISDNVLIQVGPKSTQEYEIVIPPDHVPGTFWYHAHRHGSTAGNVASGMSGALIIDGPGLDDVPAIKAAKERVMVLNQIPYIKKNSFPVLDDNGNPVIDPVTGKPKMINFDLPEGLVELQYAQWIFGPRDWNSLGRFTTVNGVQLPVIKLRPGAVERWRIVDSGQREALNLMIIPAPNAAGQGAALPPGLPFYEIANDGLPLGKLVTTNSLILYPGYRSDALVKAPDQPGEYLLIDENTADQAGLNGITESRKYIARIIVSGPRVKMALPSDDELKPFRLRAVADGELNPEAAQSATYGILNGPNDTNLFTIDRMSFDMEQARTLKLGDVAEWTLKSINDVGPVPHPFHIHVNPFEVISVKDSAGVEQLTNGPVWRDTQIIPGGGTVVLRTRYEDFAGTFVQHCHILDHEDQGMMQLIDIVDPKVKASASLKAVPAPATGSPAPGLSLPDATGTMRSLAEYRGKPVVLFFFKGHGCLHCAQQVAAFNERLTAFAKEGIQIIGVSTDSAAVLKEALAAVPCAYPILADPEGKAFAAYGCVNASGTLHGTFRIDAAGSVQWAHIASSPYLAIDSLLAATGSGINESASLLASNDVSTSSDDVAPSDTASETEESSVAANADEGAVNVLNAAPAPPPVVEIRVRQTETANDDYITWAPTACSIRVTGATADQPVVLTNDAATPGVSAGDLAFALTVARGQTATQSSLALTLPANGEWVPFILAGAFPNASSSDKDAVIEVHSGSAEGPLLGSHSLMVRVRKNHSKLSTTERDNFLKALAHLRYDVTGDGARNYQFFVRIHQLASIGLDFASQDIEPQPHPKLDYGWPDLAHKGPGFIGWHRPFLLEVERELQKYDPSVALPYWIMEEPNTLFTADFIGANVVDPSKTWVNPTFLPGNPLYGWNLSVDDDPPNQLIQRSPVLFQPKADGAPNLFGEKELFVMPNAKAFSLYPRLRTAGGFVEALEFNPHNLGHNWLGPWMQNCQTSPRDPVFWIFHAGFDRLWARWQRQFDRFDPGGQNNSYCPLGEFDQPGPVCAAAAPDLFKNCNDIDPRKPNTCVPVNHNLNDRLWPWNGLSGKADTVRGSYPQPDLTKPYLHPFPASGIPGVWPVADAQPRQADVIDYFGLSPSTPPGNDMNFAYDDTPYGVQPAQVPAVLAANMKAFSDSAQPQARRLLASKQLSGSLDTAAKQAQVATVLHTASEPEAVRLKALELVHESSASASDQVLKLLAKPESASPALATAGIKILTEELMRFHGAERHASIAALEQTLADPREPVRLEALRSLTALGHDQALETALLQALQKPGAATFTPAQAILGLAGAGLAHKHAERLRAFLGSPDKAVQQAAITALAADPGSQEAIGKLLADTAQPAEIRLAALQAFAADASSHLPALVAIMSNPAETAPFRAEAIATVHSAMRSHAFTEAELASIQDSLSGIDPAQAQRIGPIVGTALLKAAQKLSAAKK